MKRADCVELNGLASIENDPLGTRTFAPQGRVPFGFRQNPYGRAVHDPEMKWIEYIHELASQGFSTEKIAFILNKEDRQTKRAGKWSRTAIWRILKRFKKIAVTKPLCNTPIKSPSSVTPTAVASKAPPNRIRSISPSEKLKHSVPEFPKPLQINDFLKWLPDMDSNHDCYLQRVECYRYTIRE
jgi:hypothetical protein